MTALFYERLLPVISLIVNHIQQGVTDTCRDIAPALSSPGDNVRRVGLHNQLLRLHNIYEAYGNSYNQIWGNFLLFYQFIKPDQSRRREIGRASCRERVLPRV